MKTSTSMSLVTAAAILAISFGVRLAGIDREISQRAMMIVVGLFLTFTANTIPKTLTPLSAEGCDPARAQACRRFVGWTWVCAGLALTAVWLTLPVELARPASIVLIVSAMSATVVQVIRLRRLPPRAA